MMVKRRPLDAITKAASRPVDTQKPHESNDQPEDSKRYTVNRKPERPKRWEDRTKRHTFHADIELLKRFKKHSKKTKESLAQLHHRAMLELLEREEQT